MNGYIDFLGDFWCERCAWDQYHRGIDQLYLALDGYPSDECQQCVCCGQWPEDKENTMSMRQTWSRVRSDLRSGEITCGGLGFDLRRVLAAHQALVREGLMTVGEADRARDVAKRAAQN